MCGSVLCDLRALLKISVFLLQVRWCVLRVTGAQEAHYRCWEGVIRGGRGQRVQQPLPRLPMSPGSVQIFWQNQLEPSQPGARGLAHKI